ncbi:16S rRNA (uracil(1498)-N(3))-methyltransferase [Flavobacterium sp. xlx-214]|uniref:16S rRNA (uracil(1498)-N(3))-methyltransferase n=1 Tax=unclassified Flavobacterium TaxID=196869 RepID=UPI0013D272C9|nr:MULTISPECIES: 16S rRNA (uracil(1498)-N(3))-methyltransferase [unclassified Flavobacterium]MBA5791809.1 16S rRNA (uracil(1498)-N(3))-methyltransferase [Flavobacterium sp. xlx-221]QMI83046.1 16S rRNA (uracil(1498)-N(3))-methyltransferase [Flavobacterium sp. xlx-214]
MQLFYAPDIDSQSNEFIFDKEESKHIVKVLRKTEGSILHITNGKGFLFTSEIILASEKKCVVKITNIHQEKERSFKIHMVVAPTKMNDRYEWFLEKAAEIGVDEITPIICDHSERKVIKTERFDKILISAMKQSNQFYLPVLNDPIKLSEFLNKEISGQKFIAHCEETSKKELKEQVNLQDHYTLLIGPEGDFSSNEIEKALQKGYLPAALGNTRLRTETAAIVGCHTFVLLNN